MHVNSLDPIDYFDLMKFLTRQAFLTGPEDFMKTNRFTGTTRRETYQEACKDNWPAQTCRACYGPRGRDRDGLCEPCLRDLQGGFFERVTTQPKALLPMKEPRP